MNRAIGASLVVVGMLVLGTLFSSVYTINQTQEVLIVQFGAPVAIQTDPGLHFKWPWQQATFFDKRLLNLDARSEEVIALDKKRILVDAFARWRIVDPLLFKQAMGDEDTAVKRLTPILSSDIRRVLGSANFSAVLSARRGELMHQIRDNMGQDVKAFGIRIVDVHIRRADLPSENSNAIYQRMIKERQREAAEFRAEGDETAQRIRARAEREATVIKAEATREASILRGSGDAEKTRILGEAYSQDPNFFSFYRSMEAYKAALQGNNTTVILSPKSDFFRYFGEGPGGGKK